MAAKSRRPNILLITCDQWRGDCLSAAGHPVVKTPNADALAAEGVLFKRHYGGAAPCSPARACLYTGLYQMNNRVCRNGTPLDARHGNIALLPRAPGLRSDAVRLHRRLARPAPMAPGDPRLKSYEGVLPGFTRAPASARASETMAVMAEGTRRRYQRRLSRHPPPRGEASRRGRDQRAAGLFAKTRRRRPFWPASSSAGWASRTGRPGSRISPSSARIRPSSCRSPTTRCMIRPTARPFAAQESWRAEARAIPISPTISAGRKRRSFRPGTEGKVRDWGDDDFRAIRAIYYGMISEVDAQLGRIWQAVKAAAPGTTRSSC